MTTPLTVDQARAAYNIAASLGHWWAITLGPEWARRVMTEPVDDRARWEALRAAVTWRAATGHAPPDGLPASYTEPATGATTSTGRCQWWVERHGSVSVVVSRPHPMGEAFMVTGRLTPAGPEIGLNAIYPDVPVHRRHIDAAADILTAGLAPDVWENVDAAWFTGARPQIAQQIVALLAARGVEVLP